MTTNQFAPLEPQDEEINLIDEESLQHLARTHFQRELTKKELYRAYVYFWSLDVMYEESFNKPILNSIEAALQNENNLWEQVDSAYKQFWGDKN